MADLVPPQPNVLNILRQRRVVGIVSTPGLRAVGVIGAHDADLNQCAESIPPVVADTTLEKWGRLDASGSWESFSAPQARAGEPSEGCQYADKKTKYSFHV